MSADQDQLARNIVRVLERGSLDLNDHAIHRLRTAREQALMAYRPPHEGILVTTGHAIAHWLERPGAGLRYLLPVAALVVGLAGIVLWQTGNGGVNELADRDARLLTDDLPIDAYLDKGFDSWLKRQSR